MMMPIPHGRCRLSKQPVSKRLGACENRGGAVAVEFATVLPVVLLLFLGALEMTNLHFLRQTAADAAYEGARAALVAGGSAERAQERAEQHLVRCGVRGGPEVLVSGTDDGISVQVSLPVNRNSFGLTYFSRGLAVSRECTLCRETHQGNP